MISPETFAIALLDISVNPGMIEAREKTVLDQIDYVMITVSDMKRSIVFYQDMLGLDVKHRSEGWTELATGSTVLVLQGGGAALPSREAEFQGAPVAGSCSIGFSVFDVDKLYEELSGKGVRFSMPPAVRQQGIKLAVCQDPDGVSIAFTTRTDMLD